MTVVALITTEEADTFNVLSNDWVVSSEAAKEAHIFNASLFMSSNWTCTTIDGEGEAVPVDWEDPETLNTDLKRACAYYAEADRLGVLFDPMTKEDVHGKKTMEKKRLGDMEKTIQWSLFGAAVNGNPLDVVDTLMFSYCSYSSSQGVVRV